MLMKPVYYPPTSNLFDRYNQHKVNCFIQWHGTKMILVRREIMHILFRGMLLSESNRMFSSNQDLFNTRTSKCTMSGREHV